MIGVMKHIRLLVMIGLCLNPVTMMASEWTNIPVPSLNPETQPTGNKVLERIMASALGHIENDPKLVLLQIAAGCLVLMICYMHKTGSLGRTVNQARDAVKKEIKAWFDRLPMPVKAAMMPLKVVADFACGTAAKYIRNNKTYMFGAAGVPVIGYLGGFPVIGGAVGGISFIAGLIQSIRQELQAMREENQRLHDATHKKLDTLSTAIQDVSGKIDATKQEISAQIKSVGDNVNIKIDDVGSKVEKLNLDLKDVPQQLMKLLDDIRVMDSKETQRDQRINDLFTQLEQANKDYLSAQENLGALSRGLIEKVTELTKSTTEQLTSIQSKTDSQEKKIDELLQKETERNSILELLRKGQQENNEQVIKLSEKIDEKDKEKLKLLEQIRSVHESNALQFTQGISTLGESQKTMQTACDNLFSKVENIEKHVGEIEENVSTLTSQVGAVVISNQAVASKVGDIESVLKRQTAELKKQKQEYRKQVSQSQELNTNILQIQLKYTENIAKLRDELNRAYKALDQRLTDTQDLIRGQSAIQDNPPKFERLDLRLGTPKFPALQLK